MIAHHTVPADDFAALAAGGGDAAVAGRLLDGQLSRRMLLFEAVRESAPDATRDAVERGYSLLARLQREHPPAVVETLLLPAAGLWASACLRGGDEPVYRHLGSFAAAAATRAGIDFELVVPVWNGSIVLPGLGSAPTATGLATHGLRGGPGWRPMRELRADHDGLGLRVVVDDTDPFRGPPESPLAPPASGADEWQRAVTGAWEILVRRHREQAAALSRVLRVLTPLRAPRPGANLSVTAADACGAVLLTPPASAPGLALTLLHEFQHAKLAALHTIVPLHVPDADPRWYARWREDPRPVGSLLHGAYAHLGVAAFWHQAVAEPFAGALDPAAEFAYWRDGVAEALDQLNRSGLLTEAGRRFTDGMSGALERMTERTRVPRAAARAAAERASRHRVSWNTRHRRNRALT
jgi:HEXXH motif-containing protein